MRLIRLLKNDLAHEVQEWVQDQVISEQQGESICQRYGVDYHQLNRRAFGYYVLLALGYSFIGLALITLLSANWEDIPRGVRMGGLIGLTAGIHLFAIARYRQGNQRAAVLAAFIGNIAYGVSIMLIAQIYHLGEHYPDGIYWWALGALPAALLLQSRLLMLLSASLAAIWFLVEASLGYYPASFPLFLAALGWLVMLRKGSNLMFLGLVAGFVLWSEYTLSWWLGQGHRFDFGAEQLTLGVGYTMLAFALSNWLVTRGGMRWTDYGVLLDLWVVRLALLVLLVLSFEDTWREYLRDIDNPAVHSAIIVICSITAVALNWLSRPPRVSVYFFSVVFATLFLFAVLEPTSSRAIIYQVISNVLLLGAGIWLIQSGIARRISHYFYLGVATVLITGLVRYIDLVGDYVGASVLFMVFAMILLASARYWNIKQRGDNP